MMNIQSFYTYIYNKQYVPKVSSQSFMRNKNGKLYYIKKIIPSKTILCFLEKLWWKTKMWNKNKLEFLIPIFLNMLFYGERDK